MPRRLIVEIVGDPRGLEQAFNRAAGATQTFGDKLRSVGATTSRVGRRLTAAITLPIVGAGVASVKMAADFETSMSRVEGLAGQSQKQVAEWSDELLRLGPSLGKGPRELADALYFVASSGIPAGKALSVVTAAAKASTAGMGDTAVVADAVTSAMNAYGAANMSAARATDVLVATVREGKGEAADFAPVIGNVTAFASKLGVSFEEVGASLASMTQLGTDAATAATQLSAFFSQLVKETPRGAKALDAVGLSYQGLRDTLAGPRGVRGALDDIRTAFDGNVPAMAAVFGNIRALRAVFALAAEDGGKVAGVFERLGQSTGSMDAAFKAAAERSGFSLEKLKAAAEAAGISLGMILLPVVAQIAEHLGRLAIAFSNLDPETKKLIISIAAIAAVVGPALIIFGSLAGAVAALIPVFIALASPIGLIVIGIALLAGAIAAAVLAPEQLSNVLQKMGLSATQAEQVVESLQNAFTAIKAVVDAVWPAIQNIVIGALKTIQGILVVVGALLRGDWAEVWRGMKLILEGALQAMLGLMTIFPRLVLAAALAIGQAALTGIQQGLAALGTWLREKLQEIPGALRAAAAAAPVVAAAIGRAIVEGIGTGLANLGASVGNKLLVIRTVLIGVAGQAAGWASGIGYAIVSGILSGVGGLYDALRSRLEGTLRSVLSSLNPFSPVEEGGARYIGRPLAEGAVRGWLEGTAGLASNIEETLRSTVARAAGLANLEAAIPVSVPATAEDPVIEGERNLQSILSEIQRAGIAERAMLRQEDLANDLSAFTSYSTSLVILAEQLNLRLIATFVKYRVPFQKAAVELGMALVQGLEMVRPLLAATAASVKNEIMQHLSNIQVRVNVDVVVPDRPDRNIPGRQHGGRVLRDQPYIVGEAGPELFIPGRSGTVVANGASLAAAAGGSVVNVYIDGDVTGEEIVNRVREGLLRIDLYNSGSAIARA